MDIQHVEALPDGQRPETGPMQFGDDWPGVFVRGDNALWDARMLRGVLQYIPEDDWNARVIVEGLIKTLGSCSVGNTSWLPLAATE